MAESQAKVAQEIAIARRIDTAEEVIIEEYYEGAGEGKIGLNAEVGNVNLGLSGAGRRISKRVYTFKGWRDGGLEGWIKSKSLTLNREIIYINKGCRWSIKLLTFSAIIQINLVKLILIKVR